MILATNLGAVRQAVATHRIPVAVGFFNNYFRRPPFLEVDDVCRKLLRFHTSIVTELSRMRTQTFVAHGDKKKRGDGFRHPEPTFEKRTV